MNGFELAFFGLASLFVLVGGIITVGAKNPIRGAMGLLVSIVGIAAHYLMLSAEFLAAVQIIVYAGAVVVLFLFVIMLLGPSATSGRDARTAIPRYTAAGVLLASVAGVVLLLLKIPREPLAPPPNAPLGLGTIEGIGHELFTTNLAPFELSGALLLVAVVGAVAVARGKQPDPTMLVTPDRDGAASGSKPRSASGTDPNAQPSKPSALPAKEAHP